MHIPRRIKYVDGLNFDKMSEKLLQTKHPGY